MGSKTEALWAKLSIVVAPYVRFNPVTRKVEHVDGYIRSGTPSMTDLYSALRSYTAEKNYYSFSAFKKSQATFGKWLTAYSEVNEAAFDVDSTVLRDNLKGHMAPLSNFMLSDKFQTLSKAQKTWVVKEYARSEALLRLSRLSSRLDNETITKHEAELELAYLADKFDKNKVGYFFEKAYPVKHKRLTEWYQKVVDKAKFHGIDAPEVSIKKPPTPTELDVKTKGVKGSLTESMKETADLTETLTIATLPNTYFVRPSPDGEEKTKLNVGDSLWVSKTTPDGNTFWVHRANGTWVQYRHNKKYAKKLGTEKPADIVPADISYLETEGVTGKQKVISTADLKPKTVHKSEVTAYAPLFNPWGPVSWLPVKDGEEVYVIDHNSLNEDDKSEGYDEVWIKHEDGSWTRFKPAQAKYDATAEVKGHGNPYSIKSVTENEVTPNLSPGEVWVAGDIKEYKWKGQQVFFPQSTEVFVSKDGTLYWTRGSNDEDWTEWKPWWGPNDTPSEEYPEVTEWAASTAFQYELTEKEATTLYPVDKDAESVEETAQTDEATTTTKVVSLPVLDGPDYGVEVPIDSKVWVKKDEADMPEEMWIEPPEKSPAGTVWKHIWYEHGSGMKEQQVVDPQNTVMQNIEGNDYTYMDMKNTEWVEYGTDVEYDDVPEVEGSDWYSPPATLNPAMAKMKPTKTKGVFEATETFMLRRRSSMSGYEHDPTFLVEKGDLIIAGKDVELSIYKEEDSYPTPMQDLYVIKTDSEGRRWVIHPKNLYTKQTGFEVMEGLSNEEDLDKWLANRVEIIEKSLNGSVESGLTWDPVGPDGSGNPGFYEQDWELHVPSPDHDNHVWEFIQQGLLEWDTVAIDDWDVSFESNPKLATGLRVTAPMELAHQGGKNVKLDVGDVLLTQSGASTVILYKKDKDKVYAVRQYASKLTKPKSGVFDIVWAEPEAGHKTPRRVQLFEGSIYSLNALEVVEKGKKGKKSKFKTVPPNVTSSTPMVMADAAQTQAMLPVPEGVSPGNHWIEAQETHVMWVPDALKKGDKGFDYAPVILNPGDRVQIVHGLVNHETGNEAVGLVVQRDGYWERYTYDTKLGVVIHKPVITHGEYSALPLTSTESPLEYNLWLDSLVSIKDPSKHEGKMAPEGSLLDMISKGVLKRETLTTTALGGQEIKFHGYVAQAKVEMTSDSITVTLMPGDALVGRSPSSLMVRRKNGQIYQSTYGYKKMGKITFFNDDLYAYDLNQLFGAPKEGPFEASKMWNELGYGVDGWMTLKFDLAESVSTPSSSGTAGAGAGGKRLKEMKSLVADVEAAVESQGGLHPVIASEKLDLEALGSIHKPDSPPETEWIDAPSLWGGGESVSLGIPSRFHGKKVQGPIRTRKRDVGGSKFQLEYLVAYGDDADSVKWEYVVYAYPMTSSSYHYGWSGEVRKSHVTVLSAPEADHILNQTPMQWDTAVVSAVPTHKASAQGVIDSAELDKPSNSSPAPVERPAFGWNVTVGKYDKYLVRPGDTVIHVYPHGTTKTISVTDEQDLAMPGYGLVGTVIIPKDPSQDVLTSFIGGGFDPDWDREAQYGFQETPDWLGLEWNSQPREELLAKAMQIMEDGDIPTEVHVRPEPTEEHVQDLLMPMPDGTWRRVQAGDLIQTREGRNGPVVRIHKLDGGYEYYDETGQTTWDRMPTVYEKWKEISPDALFDSEDVEKYPGVIKVPTRMGTRAIRLEEGQKAYMRYDPNEPTLATNPSAYQGNSVVVIGNGEAFYFKSGTEPEKRTPEEVDVMFDSGDWVEMETRLPQVFFAGSKGLPVSMRFPSDDALSALGDSLEPADVPNVITRLVVPTKGYAHSTTLANSPWGPEIAEIIHEDAHRVGLQSLSGENTYTMLMRAAGQGGGDAMMPRTTAKRLVEESAQGTVMTVKTVRGNVSVVIPEVFNVDEALVLNNTSAEKTSIYVPTSADPNVWHLLQMRFAKNGMFTTYQWTRVQQESTIESIKEKKAALQGDSPNVVSVKPLDEIEQEMAATVAKYDFGAKPMATWEEVSAFIGSVPLQKFLHAKMYGNEQDALFYETLLGKALLSFEATKKAHPEWDATYKSRLTKIQNIIKALLQYSAVGRMLQDEPEELPDDVVEMMNALVSPSDIDPPGHFVEGLANQGGEYRDWFNSISNASDKLNQRILRRKRLEAANVTDPDMQEVFLAWLDETYRNDLRFSGNEDDLPMMAQKTGKPYTRVVMKVDEGTSGSVSRAALHEKLYDIIKAASDKENPPDDYLDWVGEEELGRLTAYALLGNSISKQSISSEVRQAYQKAKTIDAMKAALADISPPTTQQIPDYINTELLQNPQLWLQTGAEYIIIKRVGFPDGDDWEVVDGYNPSGEYTYPEGEIGQQYGMGFYAEKHLNGEKVTFSDQQLQNMLHEHHAEIDVVVQDDSALDEYGIQYTPESEQFNEKKLDAYLKESGAKGISYMTPVQKHNWANLHHSGARTLAFYVEVRAYEAKGKQHPDLEDGPYSLETDEGKVRFKAFLDWYASDLNDYFDGNYHDGSNQNFFAESIQELGLTPIYEAFREGNLGDVLIKPSTIDDQEWEFILGLNQLSGEKLSEALSQIAQLSGDPWLPPVGSAYQEVLDIIHTNYPTAEPPQEVVWLTHFAQDPEHIQYLPNLTWFIEKDLSAGKYNKDLPEGSFGAIELPDGSPYFLKFGEKAVYMLDESGLPTGNIAVSTPDGWTAYYDTDGYHELFGHDGWVEGDLVPAALLDIPAKNVTLEDVKESLVVSKKKPKKSNTEGQPMVKFIDVDGLTFGPLPADTVQAEYIDAFNGNTVRFKITRQGGEETIVTFPFDGVPIDWGISYPIEKPLEFTNPLNLKSVQSRGYDSTITLTEESTLSFPDGIDIVDATTFEASTDDRIFATNLFFRGKDGFFVIPETSLGGVSDNIVVLKRDGTDYLTVTSHDEAYDDIHEGVAKVVATFSSGYWHVHEDAEPTFVFTPTPSGVFHHEEMFGDISPGQVPVYYAGKILHDDSYLFVASYGDNPQTGVSPEDITPGVGFISHRALHPNGWQIYETVAAPEDKLLPIEDGWLESVTESVILSPFGETTALPAQQDTGLTATLVKSAWDEMQQVEASTPADIQPFGQSELMYWTENDYNIFLFENGFSAEFLMASPFTVRKWLGVALYQKPEEEKTSAAVAVVKEKYRLGGWGAQSTKPVFSPEKPYTIFVAAGVPTSQWSHKAKEAFYGDYLVGAGVHESDAIQKKLDEMMSVSSAFVEKMKAKPKKTGKSGAAAVDVTEELTFTATTSSGGNKGSHHSGEMTDQYGRRWWVKPSMGDATGTLSPEQHLYRTTAEYGAAKAFQLFGFKHPPCLIADIDGTSIDHRYNGKKMPTFVHLYVKNKDDDGKPLSMHRFSSVSQMSETQLIQLATEHVGDWMTSQHDSHPDNLMLDANGNLFGIDKGQAFKFFPKDQLKVGYKGDNPEHVVYDMLYNAITNHELTEEQSQNIALAVLRKAAYMSKHYDTEYSQLLDMVFSTASAKDSRAFGWEKHGFKSKEAVIEALLERKHELLASFFDLYKGIFDKAGYDFPWESPDDITRSVIEYPGSGEKSYVGISQEYIETVSKTRGIGTPTLVSTDDLLYGSIISWEELNVDGSTIFMMQGNVLPDAGEGVETWVSDHDITNESTGQPTKTTGATTKILPMADMWYGMLTEGAKTINTHQADGDYNTDKISAMNSAGEQIGNARTALETWYTEHEGDKVTYAAVFDIGTNHAIHFADREQMDAFYEMVKFYDDQYAALNMAHQQHTKTYTDPNNKILPQYLYKPSEASTKLKVEEKWASQTDIIEKLSNGVYKHTNLMTGEAVPIEDSEALKLIEGMSVDDTKNLGTIGGEQITFHKTKAGRAEVVWDFDKGIATRTGEDTKHTGETWEIHVGDDIVVKYYPQSGSLNNSTSQKGIIRIEVYGFDGSGERVQRAIDLLNEMGIDTNPADETSMELMYWKMVAGTLAERKLTTAKEKALFAECTTILANMKDMTPEQAIAAFRQAFAKYYGSMEVVDSIDWRPHFPHGDVQSASDGISGGVSRWQHPDVATLTYDEITKIFTSRPFMGHAYHFDGASPLDAGRSGALVASAERKRMFSRTYGGISTGHDDGSGGANGIFSWPKNDGPDVVFSPLVSLNLASFVLTGDSYGKVEMRKHVTPFPWTKMLTIGNTGDTMGHAGEWSLRFAVTLLDDMLVMRMNQQQRQEMLDYLKKYGITEIRGVPIEERIVTSIPGHAALLELWKREVAWRIEHGYEIGDMVAV